MRWYRIGGVGAYSPQLFSVSVPGWRAMIIHRSGPVSNFVQIPNATARDVRLSYQARGVLAEILSRPADWETSADALWRDARRHRGEAGEGRDQLRAAFAELTGAGYLHRERSRDRRGRFFTVLHVFDTPDGLEAWQAAEAFRATVENPLSREVSAGGTDDGTGSRRSDQEKSASPQVAPATVYQAPVDQAPVDQPSAGQASLRKPEDEDWKTNTVNENQADEDHVGVLTSPVPVEGESAGPGQQRLSDDEWDRRERIVAREFGPLPEVAPMAAAAMA